SLVFLLAFCVLTPDARSRLLNLSASATQATGGRGYPAPRTGCEVARHAPTTISPDHARPYPETGASFAQMASELRFPSGGRICRRLLPSLLCTLPVRSQQRLSACDVERC